MQLTKFEFKILQSLANMVWIKNHLRKTNINQDYLLRKLDYKEFDPEPYYLINQFDSHNLVLLWGLITDIQNKETKYNLIKIFAQCTGLDQYKETKQTTN